MTLFSRAARLGHLAVKLVSALAGTALAATAPAAAQTVAPDQAPAEWVRYAELATRSVTQWLQAESEPAVRVRAYLDATRPTQDQPTKPFVLQIWIDADGAIARVGFAPFAHEEPNADLRALIVGQRLPEAPPRNMLLPLRILVQLPPAPPDPLRRDPQTATGFNIFI